MNNTNRILGNLPRDLFILEDEDNPRSSQVNNIWPSTILDQVFDDQSPTNKTLREILEDLKQDIITGGRGNIVFPVTSVNGKNGDIIITKNEVGLGRADNTADIDKPLSTPQREAINKILKDYDFNINLSELYDHIMDTNNPHDVTIDQINKDDALVDFVQDYISKHNYSTHNTIHMDIRRSLSQLWMLVEEINNGIEERVTNLIDVLNNHIEDNNPHQEVFDTKEDVANKVMSFNKLINNDHTHYPSTRAVVEYVGQKIAEFNETLPNIETWIQDINIIDSRDQLPAPVESRLREAYFIRNGVGSHDEIAICRPNEDNTYYWDISHLGSYSKFNPDHFIDTPDGLSINLDGIASLIFESIQDDEVTKLVTDAFDGEEDLSIITIPLKRTCGDNEFEKLIYEDISTYVDDVFNLDHSVLPTIPYVRIYADDDLCHCLDDYEGICRIEIHKAVYKIFDGNTDITMKTYPIPTIFSHRTDDEGNTNIELSGISSISIITGTMDGHIRYYVNGDMSTMSDNIKVAGLKRLAYMEYVTENEIWDQAIHSHHIRDRAIESRHIKDMGITPEKIKCTNGYLIGNTSNDEEPMAGEISLMDLAEAMRPYIGGSSETDIGKPESNSYYQKLGMQIMHPQLWRIGYEYDLGDYSYGVRFSGTISCIPNMNIRVLLTSNMKTTNGHRITDAGGVWVYQSDPLCWTVLGGSNITGHTFATITMDNKGLYFESISTGDRIDATFDVWVRYVKTKEYENVPMLDNAGYVIPIIGAGAEVEGPDIGSGSGTCDCDERWEELSDDTINDIINQVFEDN